MNRLSPLIVRRVGPFAAPIEFVESLADPERFPDLFEDFKLFVVGWLGGLVFFGTLFS